MRNHPFLGFRAGRTSLSLLMLAAVGLSPVVAQVPGTDDVVPEARAALAALIAEAESILDRHGALRGDVAGLPALQGDSRSEALARIGEVKIQLEAALRVALDRAQYTVDQLASAGEVAAAVQVSRGLDEAQRERVVETIRYSWSVVRNRTGPIVDQYEAHILENLESMVSVWTGARTGLDRPTPERLRGGISLLVVEQAEMRVAAARMESEDGDDRLERLGAILDRKEGQQLAVSGYAEALQRYADRLDRAGAAASATRVRGVSEFMVSERIAEVIGYSAEIMDARDGSTIDSYEERIHMMLRDVEARLVDALT